MIVKPFEKRLWMASSTMHGEEQKYVKEAFDTNWLSTVGENLNEFEKSVREYLNQKLFAQHYFLPMHFADKGHSSGKR